MGADEKVTVKSSWFSRELLEKAYREAEAKKQGAVIKKKEA